MPKYKLGKDLRLKGDGHTIECYYNLIKESSIFYRTNKIESISVVDGIMWKTKHVKKPEDFNNW